LIPEKARSLLAGHGIYLALVILVFISVLLSPAFFTMSNLLNVLRAAAVLGIVSIGQTFVILGGGIDLSVGATMGTVAIAISEITRGSDDNVFIGILVCLGIGLLIGLANGLLITKRNVPPFVVTLGMLIFVEGARLAYTRGIISGRPAPFIRQLAIVHGALPTPLILLVILLLISAVVLYRTPFGRRLYAVGGNREAARFTGIRVDRVIIATYLISGLFAAIAGLVLSGYIGYGDRYLGRGFDMDSIGATVIGGTTFAGGVGGIGGTIVGVLMLTSLFNIVLILGLPVEVQLLIKGSVIIGAVLLYSAMQRKRS
jgi:ribose transport system permease protein